MTRLMGCGYNQMAVLFRTPIYERFYFKRQEAVASYIKTLITKQSKLLIGSSYCLDTCPESGGSETPGSLLIITTNDGVCIEIRLLWNTKENMFVIDAEFLPPAGNSTRLITTAMSLILFILGIAYFKSLFVSAVLALPAFVILRKVGDVLACSQQWRRALNRIEEELFGILESHRDRIYEMLRGPQD